MKERMVFEVMTQPQLDEVIQRNVRAAILDTIPDVIRDATQKPYLNKKELSELSGWSLRKIQYMMAGEKIPYIKRGRTVLFRSSDVREWLSAGFVPARKNRSDS